LKFWFFRFRWYGFGHSFLPVNSQARMKSRGKLAHRKGRVQILFVFIAFFPATTLYSGLSTAFYEVEEGSLQ
jgi:hypothetical protein